MPSVTTRAEQATWPSDQRRLPGADLVAAGLADLQAGRETVAGELVRGASTRLAELGLVVPGKGQHPDRLYELIVAEVGERAAHARYNALRRRLASFLRAADDARAG
jgi:hypothetical protein